MKTEYIYRIAMTSIGVWQAIFVDIGVGLNDCLFWVFIYTLLMGESIVKEINDEINDEINEIAVDAVSECRYKGKQ